MRVSCSLKYWFSYFQNLILNKSFTLLLKVNENFPHPLKIKDKSSLIQVTLTSSSKFCYMYQLTTEYRGKNYVLSYVFPELWSLQQEHFILQVVPGVDVGLMEGANKILQGLYIPCHMLDTILCMENMVDKKH